ncbi:MAG TPA: 50S ribosomal protein L11 methyltransferase [Solirubrobacteraceae bacterium]|nr:50S ribosomal protein L11 methyltransferase [Solirubrobacteraceae bacterium]
MIRLAVRVRRADAELVLAELLDLAPAGVEEVELDDDLLEYAVYGSSGELPALPDLEAAAGEALVEISTSETPEDWQERWKLFHRPVLIVAPAPPAGLGRLPDLWVRPPWESPSSRPDGRVQDIVIDPGQAFGTGAHATTRLCLGLLLEIAALADRPGALLDVGTGSGLLAIAGARLGFSPVVGVDNERESVQAARENASINHVEVDILHLDLRSQPLPWLGSPDGGAHPLARPAGPVLAVANLLRPLLLEVAATISQAPDHLLAGGLLIGEVDEVAAAFAARLGMHERDRRASGEWAALWLTAD